MKRPFFIRLTELQIRGIGCCQAGCLREILSVGSVDDST